MNNEEKEKIIEKIQKLLRLKDKTTSEGEAYAAACGVHRLLTKYNLSMEDIPQEDNEQQAKLKIKKTDFFSYSSIYGVWKRNLLANICHYNFCKCLCNTYSKEVRIVGEEQNVAIVRQLYDYLSTVFLRLANERYEEMCLAGIKKEALEMGITLQRARKSYIIQLRKKKFYKSYLRGVNAGLDEQFLAMQPTSDEKALMVVHTQAIDDFLKSDSDFTGKNIANRHSDDDKDMEALGVGYNDGMSISLNPQMDGDREKKELSFA